MKVADIGIFDCFKLKGLSYFKWMIFLGSFSLYIFDEHRTISHANIVNSFRTYKCSQS